MKKLPFIILAAFLMFSLFVVPSYAATDSRADVISRELDCVARTMHSVPGLIWQDVCYSLDASPEDGALAPEAAMEREQTAAARKAQVVMDTDGTVSVDGISAQQALDDFEQEIKAQKQKPAVVAVPEPEINANIERPVSGKKWYSLDPSLKRDNPLTKFEFGTEAFAYSYREPEFMKDKGYMYGIFASLTQRTRENERLTSLKDAFSVATINMFRFEGRYAYGKYDYQSEGTGQESGIPFWSVEFRGLAGSDIPILANSRLTPYVGLGPCAIFMMMAAEELPPPGIGVMIASRAIFICQSVWSPIFL